MLNIHRRVEDGERRRGWRGEERKRKREEKQITTSKWDWEVSSWWYRSRPLKTYIRDWALAWNVERRMGEGCVEEARSSQRHEEEEKEDNKMRNNYNQVHRSPQCRIISFVWDSLSCLVDLLLISSFVWGDGAYRALHELVSSAELESRASDCGSEYYIPWSVYRSWTWESRKQTYGIHRL